MTCTSPSVATTPADIDLAKFAGRGREIAWVD